MMKATAEMLEDTVEIIGADKPKSKKKKLSEAEKTKKNFETLMQPVGVLEAEPALQQKFKAYACTQLETCTNRIKQCIYNVTSNFIEIGFRLACSRPRQKTIAILCRQNHFSTPPLECPCTCPRG